MCAAPPAAPARSPRPARLSLPQAFHRALARSYADEGKGANAAGGEASGGADDDVLLDVVSGLRREIAGLGATCSSLQASAASHARLVAERDAAVAALKAMRAEVEAVGVVASAAPPPQRGAYAAPPAVAKKPARPTGTVARGAPPRSAGGGVQLAAPSPLKGSGLGGGGVAKAAARAASPKKKKGKAHIIDSEEESEEEGEEGSPKLVKKGAKKKAAPIDGPGVGMYQRWKAAQSPDAKEVGPPDADEYVAQRLAYAEARAERQQAAVERMARERAEAIPAAKAYHPPPSFVKLSAEGEAAAMAEAAAAAASAVREEAAIVHARDDGRRQLSAAQAAAAAADERVLRLQRELLDLRSDELGVIDEIPEPGELGLDGPRPDGMGPWG